MSRFKGERETNYFSEPYCKKLEGYGLHELELPNGEKLALASAYDWVDFTLQLSSLKRGVKFVVTPELITVADIELERMEQKKKKILSRVSAIRHFSTGFPETTFVLGTPVFEKEKKPTNSLLFIKNREDIGRVDKRTFASDLERQVFRANLSGGSFVSNFGKTGFLVCSDFGNLALMRGEESKIDRKMDLRGNKEMIGYRGRLVGDGVSSIIVPSCWAVGSRWIEEAVQRGVTPDEYYHNSLLFAARGVFSEIPSLKQLAVVDRLPGSENQPSQYLPSGPLNAVFSRERNLVLKEFADDVS